MVPQPAGGGVGGGADIKCNSAMKLVYFDRTNESLRDVYFFVDFAMVKGK